MNLHQVNIFLCCLIAIAIPLYGATINVEPGSGTLSQAISQSHSGDTLVLSDGTFTEPKRVEIKHPLKIRAATAAKPLVSLTKTINSNASLEIKGVSFETSASDGCIYLNHGDSLIDFTASGCTFSGFKKAVIKIYEDSRSEPYVDHLTVDDCIFKLGQETRGIEAEKAEVQLNHLKVTRSTFDGSTQGCSKMIFVSATDGATISSAVVDHCTFYNSLRERAVHLRNLDGAVVTNSILMNTKMVFDHYGFCVYGNRSKINNCISYYAQITGTVEDRANCFVRNPRFVDPASGDFSLCSNSPAVGTATDGSNLGDPRWGVANKPFDPSAGPYVPYKLPYTMAPTTSSVKVLWQMLDEDEPSEVVVRYGTSPDKLDYSVKTSDGWNVEGEGYVHIVNLTGLKPFTRYYYTVGDKNRRYSAVHSTMTAPEPGTPFRVFTISDTHGHKNWNEMQDVITGIDANIALLNGDIVTSDGSIRYWNEVFFTPGAPFLAKVPIMSSNGNHETGVPKEYRWSTFYDYFHQFSHGESLDPILDPRGEAFFHFEYGDADIIMLNLNADKSSPEMKPGSEQYEWLESTLESCTHQWILLFHHIGIYSSGHHGGSSSRQRLVPLLERYVAQGKHIIAFHGHDHSFEHLYKDGVHYVRPGCGVGNTYAQELERPDSNFTLFYKRIPCFSTLDVNPKKGKLLLTAYAVNGTPFYSYKFSLSNSTSDSDSDSDSSSGVSSSVLKSTISMTELSACGRFDINVLVYLLIICAIVLIHM